MQNRQEGFNRIVKTGLLKLFPGKQGRVIKKAAWMIFLSLLFLFSLVTICYILIKSPIFNPTFKINNDTVGTFFMFFSLSIFIGIACYALYLFLGLWGVYNTRFFRGIRAAGSKAIAFAVNRLQDLYLLIVRRRKSAGSITRRTVKGNTHFSAETALYNEHQGRMSDNSPAANIKLLLMVSAMVIASRIFIFFIGYIAHVYFNKINVGFLESFESIWVRWDSNHYLLIANNWYTKWNDDRLLIVFFPFYSLLIKFFKLFAGGNTVISALLVSNLSLIITCFYLVKLVALDYGRELGFKAVKYTLIYPFSFFLGIVYTESIFLALIVMFFYYLRKKDWLLTGFLGFFASLTRLYGILLLAPVCCEILLSSEFKAFFRSRAWKQSWKYLVKIGMLLLLIPAGFMVYLYINKDITGNWYQFYEYQRNHWTTEFGFIGDTLKGMMSAAFQPTEGLESKICIWWPEITSFVLVLALMFYGKAKIRISYLLFMLVYTFIAYSPTWLISAHRYIVVLFPVYICLALLGKTRWADTALTVVSAAMLCYCIFLFTVIGMLC